MKFSRTASILSTLLLVFLFAAVAQAQDDLPELSTVLQPSGRESSTTPSSTPTPSSTAVSTTSEAPATVTGPTSVFRLTGLPTIAGALNPSQVVPNTAGAPYLQKSSLPEGTVFIAVGAALGFFGACILIWRGIVSWSLHRSVKRANQQNTYADAKRGPSGGVYSGLAGNSTLSLALEKPNVLRSTRNFSPAGSTGSPGPRGRPDARTASSLFFSPTAGNAGAGGNRASTYLPAGYYAAGASATAGGASTTSLGPSAAGYNRAGSGGPSPPGSPRLPPSRGYDRAPPSRGADSIYRSSVAGTIPHSTSNLNLSAPPEGRAPSAYLEDLFENHGNASRERL